MEIESFYKNLYYEKEYDCYYLYDEKGNFSILSLAKEYEKLAVLLCGCQYLELEDNQLAQLKFEQKIGKSQKFKTAVVNKPTAKSYVTKREEDRFTIVDRKVKVHQVWLVSNGLKLTKAFDNKEEAMDFCRKIFDKYIAKKGE